MTNEADGSRIPSITVRPSAEEKRLFNELAAKRGVSESRLALAAVRALLRTERLAVPSIEPAPRFKDSGTDRITIRLRPGDLRAIAQRAACRNVRPSKYVAMLVRGHLLSNPPLATSELEALKLSIVVLSKYGTVWARVIHSLPSGAVESDLLRLLIETRKAFESLEKRTHDLVCESLKSWESAYG